MKKLTTLLYTGLIILVFALTGCAQADSQDENITETTTEASEAETGSLKPQLDIEYEKKIRGSWKGDKGALIFKEDNQFTAINSEGAEYSGDYSVVAAPDGNMAISLAVSEDDIKVYNAELKGGNTLVLIDELGEKAEFRLEVPENK